MQFFKPYSDKPLIQLTPVNFDDKYKLSNVTPAGFDIVLKTPATADIEFDWLAVQR